MGSISKKHRMGPIEKRGVVQAYVMLVPTVAIVMAIVLFPLIANFWISLKDVTVSDLRTAEIKVNEKFKKKPIKIGDISEFEYRFNNFSKSSQITEVIFQDILPYGLKIIEIPDVCKVSNQNLLCNLDNFKPKEKKKLKFKTIAEKEYFINNEDPKLSKPIVDGNSENRLLNLDLKFNNFIDIFTSPNFLKTIRISFTYSLFSAIGSLGLGIIAAQLLMTTFPGRGFIRGIFLIPYIAPIIAVTITWGILMDPFFGTINALLTELDIINEPVSFLQVANTKISILGFEFKFPIALTFVILFESWRYFPLAMLFILARIQSIPKELFEAAEIDGATPTQKFRNITWPLILGVLFILFLLRFIWTFNKFDDIFLLTGGAAGTKTLTVDVYETGFNIGNLGSGAANAVLVFLILVVVAIFIIKFSPKE
ncbi:sugar ABC transporter permease [Alphaproteobacteria bacterium]|nr:sugar ABC transporter permease [Alphaproteobacteria bacterium]